jgi:hypothetical protein
MGVLSIMVEGGAGIIQSLFHPSVIQCVSQAVVTIAPIYMGGVAAVLPGAGGPLVSAPRLFNPVTSVFGRDTVIVGDLRAGAAAVKAAQEAEAEAAAALSSRATSPAPVPAGGGVFKMGGANRVERRLLSTGNLAQSIDGLWQNVDGYMVLDQAKFSDILRAAAIEEAAANPTPISTPSKPGDPPPHPDLDPALNNTGLC